MFLRRGEDSMNRHLMLTIGGLVVAVTGLAIATAAMNQGSVFDARDQPVNEDQGPQKLQLEGWSEEQVRQKLQWQGWSNVRIEPQDGYFLATASKDGQTSRIAVDARTGRLRDADAESDDDDDDDDDD
jgi:hypothetical protein